ncbi:MAG: thiamine S protein [Verrucomicrobiales bacterium]|nr:thiamine S protein [Verrucomicrobiales bacterium]MBR90419.1 thiamine S protein [Verrucomicrobiales bacterium]|tara:strand:- start:24 stop:269 length:246 start_codon:yes stop_codon:yes gene_type:complete
MTVTVKFWSYFRDLTGCTQTTTSLPEGTTLGALHQKMIEQFPKLAGTGNCTLKAVGVDYQDDDHVLSDGDEVSLFPPVQGG